MLNLNNLNMSTFVPTYELNIYIDLIRTWQSKSEKHVISTLTARLYLQLSNVFKCNCVMQMFVSSQNFVITNLSHTKETKHLSTRFLILKDKKTSTSLRGSYRPLSPWIKGKHHGNDSDWLLGLLETQHTFPWFQIPDAPSAVEDGWLVNGGFMFWGLMR